MSILSCKQDHGRLAGALLLCALTFLLYQHSLRNGFVNYDDSAYVTKNPEVQRGLAWHSVVWAFTSTSEANWHPLTWLSHSADVQFFGLRPEFHHFDSMLLHTLNVVLLFLLLAKATAASLRSFMVAALFALHPLNVESVAWVAERKSLLSTLFLLLALAAYGWYVRKPSANRYSVVVLCFLLGLMAKPMIVTFPFCLLLLDYWPLHRLSSSAAGGFSGLFLTIAKLVREKIPLFLLSLGSAAIAIYAQRSAGALGSWSVLPFDQRLKNALYSYVKYIVKGIWPSRLAVFYPHPEGSLALWKAVAAALLLVLITAFVWRQRASRPYLLTGWLWYAGVMIPVIGLVQVGRQAMADRYTYLPFLGLFVAAVWLSSDLLPTARWARSIGLTAAVGTLAAFMIVAHEQIGYWHDSYTLFAHALQVTPDNGTAEYGVGAALVDMGRADEAMPHFVVATRLTPSYSSPHYSLGALLQRQNRLDEAQREYEFAIATTNDATEAAQSHNNLAVVYLQKNQQAAARREFDAALHANPNELNSLIGRASIAYQTGDSDTAIADFSRAIQVAPSPVAYFWLGRAFESKGDASSAMHAYELALRINPGFVDAQNHLTDLHSKTHMNRLSAPY